MMKTASTMGEVMVNRSGEKEISSTETMLTCTPGNKPVKIPMKTPKKRARIISRSMIMPLRKAFYGLWCWRGILLKIK